MALPPRHTPVRTNIPPVDHALRASLLQANRGLRLTEAAFGAVRLMSDPAGGVAWNELWAIGDAALERLVDMQAGWARDWLDWTRYAAQVGGATTLSKLYEREQNVFLQAGQLVSEQSVALLNLFENVEIDVLYWITERSQAPDLSSGATAGGRP